MELEKMIISNYNINELYLCGFQLKLYGIQNNKCLKEIFLYFHDLQKYKKEWFL